MLLFLPGFLWVAFPLNSTAQPQRLGDFDADGRLTVLDLGRLNAHLRGGTNVFAVALRPFADVNEDGKVDAVDAQVLADAVVGRRTLANPTRAPGVAGVVGGTDAAHFTMVGDAPVGRWILIEGGAERVVLSNGAGGRFTAVVPLLTNRLNRLFLTATGGVLGPSVTRVVDIVQDSQAPSLHIDFPVEGSTLTTSNTAIAGRVGDRLSGSRGLEVFVNNQPAKVVVGLGNNGTFERLDVPLRLGPNVIAVSARDVYGNTVTKRITVLRMLLAGPRLLAIDGDTQSAAVHERAGRPLVVRALQEDGVTPIVGKVVTFEVTRSDGRLLPVEPNRLAAPTAGRVDATADGVMVVQLLTDANGEARVWWTLGGDAGCGNNRVRATSRDMGSSVYFTASASAGPARQINIGSGNNQWAEAGGPAMEAIRAWVSDSRNGVDGVPVTFRVTHGGATVNGLAQVTVPTSRTGHAGAAVTLGFEPGPNVIEATFPDNPGLPAVFTLHGVGRESGRATRFTGLVLDNAHQPIGGADCRLTIGGQVQVMFSDARGRFAFTNTPAGPAMLQVDGGPATQVNGASIPAGTFPALTFQTIVVPNAENGLPAPVLLPRLNPANARVWGGTNDLELTCEGVAGLRMIVPAGSMRKPDGSLVTPSNPVVLSLNPVHSDDVPLPLPDGSAPPLAWTLQPAGAHFDPPVLIESPNMTGLPAGTIASFLGAAHATERFEVATVGHVVADGSSIRTDAGAGMSFSGWGGHSLPHAATGDGEGGALAGRTQNESAVEVLDDSWNLTVNGQMSLASRSGQFRLRNVPAPDHFGPGGPGTAPDFVSDDFVRVVGYSIRGAPRYVFSDYFQIRPGQIVPVGGLTFTEMPPRAPEVLSIAAPVSVLSTGQTVQLTVTAWFNGGGSTNVTARAAWTSYRTSNPNVALVDNNGLVTGRGRGVAFVTAMNDGASAVVTLRVAPDAPATTVLGVVRHEDGSPAPGMLVELFGLPNATVTGPEGRFMLTNVVNPSTSLLTVRARATDGSNTLTGSTAPLEIVPGGVTDAGIIVVRRGGGGFGPVILSGMDPEDHRETSGNVMIQDILRFVTQNSALHGIRTNLAMLGGNTAEAQRIRNNVAGLGYRLNHFTGAAIDTVALDPATTPFDALYLPTSQPEWSDGLSGADLARINARGADIIRFVGAGGGLAAFAEPVAGGFGWFPIGGLETTGHVNEQGIEVTPEGSFILRASATSVEPFHQAFIGPPGFFGLSVLARESEPPRRALILGGLLRLEPSPPSIYRHPDARTALAGETVELAARADGFPAPRLQWLKNGVPLLGRTNSILILTNVSALDSGLYTLRAANASGSAFSAEALVTVIELLPEILVHPASRTNSIGDIVRFSVTVTGAPPPVVRWYVNGGVLPLGTGTSLTLNGIDGTNAGVYFATASNRLGVARSSNATLVVRARAPVIQQQPRDQSAFEGTAVTFSVTANAAPAPDFQWHKDGVLLTGETNAVLTITHLVPGNAGNYFVVITNVAGAVTSTVAVLTVWPVVALSAALDSGGAAWSTGGASSWIGQTAVTHDGTDAALSGRIGNNQESWIQTIVTGPGHLSFWWKVSSESSFDFLRFSFDGTEQIRISGERDWALRTYPVAAGPHVLRWRYTKDGSDAMGVDAGWIDQVTFTPTP